MIEELEQRLDSFDGRERKKALAALCDKVKRGQVSLPEAGMDVNVHWHTFFSYNSNGYSPSKLAWLARKKGVAVGGIVDFDVLDALEEFLEAARALGLKGFGGLESRVFVPEFSEKVINSPGEPGIAYHCGAGFPTAKVPGDQQKFLAGLRQTAQLRNRQLMERVNKYLRPVELDYEKEVLVLTPAGNATERHVCLAYARKARKLLGGGNELRKFWVEKLGAEAEKVDLPESVGLLNLIRARTMKQGGAGYVVPDKGSFPLMADTNRFFLACGAIPTYAWLDGTSDGEKEIERLLETAMSTGVEALNIIPDRNYKPGVKDQKVKNLYDVVKLAESLNLPVLVGTEMNSPGQKFVDSFDTEELAPLVPVFLKGAHIVYAHSVLQQRSGLGYTSQWAKRNFPHKAERNEFYEEAGRTFCAEKENAFSGFDDNAEPKAILRRTGS